VQRRGSIGLPCFGNFRVQSERALCDDRDLALSQLQTSDGRHQIPIERENMPSIADPRAPVIIGLALAAILASSAFAADQPPDIKGKWVGRTHTIVAGSGAHWPTNKGTFEKPGLLEKDLVIEVTGQEGRRLFFGEFKPFPARGSKSRTNDWSVDRQ
jgi:hypothetical protein